MTRSPTRSVLMADPSAFDVAYVINPHMAGNVGRVDRALAVRQWEAVRDAYRAIGLPVHVLPPAEGLPDLVFVANPSIAALRDGEPIAVLSNMAAPERRAEVAISAAFYRSIGVPTVTVASTPVEGCGDLLWQGHRLLAGHGFRTTAAAGQEVAAALGVPAVSLRLVDPDFYHLDTCLLPLGPEVALYVPSAFDEPSTAALRAAFRELVPVPTAEAMAFACNGCCPDGRHLLLPTGCPTTERIATSLGFTPIVLDTSEFLKSGGSVFCMTQLLPFAG
jgi:N-dimethylarginine dimethylaminohydrolase